MWMYEAWMNYEPRSLKEILSFKETAETEK